MILKALCDYYDLNRDRMPVEGRELKQIAFILVINDDGQFIRIEDRRLDARSAQEFLVRKQPQRSGTKPPPTYLYDNSKYVLGTGDTDDKCLPRFNSFKKLVFDTLLKAPDNRLIKAMAKFYEQGREAILKAICQDPLWDDVAKNLNKKYSYFSFLLQGTDCIAAADDDLLALVDDEDEVLEGRCLITGICAPIVRITTPTPIAGGKSNGSMVSFQVNSGYDSYGKEQAYNAPISKEAEFRYSTALKSMLLPESRHKFQFGTRTFVFWCSQTGEAGQQLEEGLFSLFGYKESESKSESEIEQVRKTFKSVFSGQLQTNLDDRFYILGLAPNSARIAVSYWAEVPLREFAGYILRHFDAMDIIDTRKNKQPYFGLYSLLKSITSTGKASDASPNLPEQIAKSIFQGLPYPFALFMGVLNRVRAGQTDVGVSITQAAIMKAYLNRLNNNNNKKLEVMLDKENTNQGYLCGRLFAVLDKIQQDANNINTIRERYMNSASATPAAVFATILNLSNHHAEKLNMGSQIHYEKIKQEIMDKISADGFPAHLDLQDQGRFFVGYYHQRQELFKKTNAEDGEEQEQSTEQN